MIAIRAVPDDFDNVQALHSPYGAVYGLGASIASPVDLGGPSYANHIMRPPMVDMRRDKGDSHLLPTGLTPTSSIGLNPSLTPSTSEIWSPMPTSFSVEGLYHRHGPRSQAFEPMDSEPLPKPERPPAACVTKLVGRNTGGMSDKTDGEEYQDSPRERKESEGHGRRTPGPPGKQTTTTNIQGPPMQSEQTALSPLRAARAISKHYWNRLSCLWQARVPPGQVKVSWICVSASQGVFHNVQLTELPHNAEMRRRPLHSSPSLPGMCRHGLCQTGGRLKCRHRYRRAKLKSPS